MRLYLAPILFSIILTSGFSQITHENQYENQYELWPINRINLEISGEKYYETDYLNNKVFFYNSDHTLWKTIDLILPPFGSSLEHIRHISQAKINSDNLIEIGFSYTYYSTAISAYVNECLIQNEDGTILLIIPDVQDFSISEINGIDSKIIAENILNSQQIAKVYSIPGLILENEYTSNNLTRVNLEISGEKYYTFNQTTQQANFYNSDHSFWKTVNCPTPTNGNLMAPYHVSETKIDPDSSVEIAYCYNVDVGGNYSNGCRIVNELGSILLQMDNTFYVIVDEAEGLPTKLITYSNTNEKSKVYSLPDLTLEYTCYADFLRRRQKLENSGYKYYYLNINNQSVSLLNPDYSLWKAINLPSLNYSSLVINSSDEQLYLSESNIICDNELEIGYSYNYQFNGLTVYESRIVNESGNFSYIFQNAYKVLYSDLPDLENKILVANITNINSDSTLFNSDVYDLNCFLLGNVPLNENDSKVDLYPNPMNTYFELNFDNLSCDALTIFDYTGKVVLSLSKNIPSKIDVSAIQGGIYFVEGSNNNQSVFRKKIQIIR